MAISFDSLLLNASLFSIYSQAGRMFEEQVKNDPGTDYTQSKAFKDAIWFIAERAKRRGFYGLQGMSTEEVASDIGNQIAAVASQAAPSFDSLLLNASLYSIYSQAGRMFAEQVKNDPGTDYTQPKAFKDAIWFIAEEAKRRGFYELQGISIGEIASGIGEQIQGYQDYKARHGGEMI